MKRDNVTKFDETAGKEPEIVFRLGGTSVQFSFRMTLFL